MKQIPYKGGTRNWSNRYHFNGGTPADLTHWTTLATNVVAAEKLCMSTRVSYIEWLGYAAGSDVAVASGSLSGTGALALAGSEQFPPGDVAAFIRWSTTARTSKNHPIYLFSYYHGIKYIPSTDPDRLQSGQHGLMDTFGAAWVSGFSDGSNTLVRAGPNGATGFGATTQYELTHRDFPR